jgi:hypothetical protein
MLDACTEGYLALQRYGDAVSVETCWNLTKRLLTMPSAVHERKYRKLRGEYVDQVMRSSTRNERQSQMMKKMYDRMQIMRRS